MEFTALLVVHIACALMTGVVMLTACFAVFTNRSELYRSLSLLLAVLSGFDVVTGTGLAVLSSSVTVVSVCTNIALYIGFIASVQVLLFMRMQGGAVRFPSVQTISSYGLSMTLLLAAAALGF